MDLAREITSICAEARHAALAMASASRAQKDGALQGIAQAIRTERALIFAENALDLEEARAKGTRGALLDRLALDDARIEAMANTVEQIALFADPVGDVISEYVRPSGITISRVRVPIGVIAMIYEARPNVTVEASALTVKAGNAVVLRGGTEAARSNAVLARIIGDAIAKAGLPRAAVRLVPFADRDAVRLLVQQTEYVDLAIPRGGEALIRFVTENARVPVVQHFKGVCHMFVDAGADLEMATRLVMDGKLSRPGVCNALECLLVDVSDAKRLLPPIAAALMKGGCELRGCERTQEILQGVRAATEDDWGHEYLDKIIAVRVVDGIDGALAHVARYGSRHTEAICTPSAANEERWGREVDAACVVVNASTRFHDGGELGLGAEIGIATSRLHWRGPMGLEALTTMKWVVRGTGQTRG